MNAIPMSGVQLQMDATARPEREGDSARRARRSGFDIPSASPAAERLSKVRTPLHESNKAMIAEAEK